MEPEIKPTILLYKRDYNEEFCETKHKRVLSLLTSDTVKPLIDQDTTPKLFMFLIFACSVAGNIKSEIEILLDESHRRFVSKICVPNGDLTILDDETLDYLKNLCIHSQELQLVHHNPDIFITAYLYYQNTD